MLCFGGGGSVLLFWWWWQKCVDVLLVVKCVVVLVCSAAVLSAPILYRCDFDYVYVVAGAVDVSVNCYFCRPLFSRKLCRFIQPSLL